MILENCGYFRDSRAQRQVRALLSQGYQVSVISPRSPETRWHRCTDDIHIYQFPVVPSFHTSLGYLFEYLYAMLAISVLTAYVSCTRGFDVVHIANPPDCMVLVTAFYKLIGKRIIYDQHDLCPELYAAKFPHPNRFLLRLQFLLERVSYRLADHTIVTNESGREIAIRRGGLAQSRVTVVRNGPEMERANEQDTDLALRPKYAHIILFAGITGYQDGLDYLCRIVRSLRYDLGREDFLCLVVGDGPALPYIKNLSKALRVENLMSFVGWVSEPNLYFRYIATADICVAPEPSNEYNNLSTFVKIMEYLVCGRPIVAFDLPENRFSAGDAALYATPNNERQFAEKLAELMDDDTLRLTLGERGRQRIKTSLAWQYSIPKFLAVYDLVLQSKAVANGLPDKSPTVK